MRNPETDGKNLVSLFHLIVATGTIRNFMYLKFLRKQRDLKIRFHLLFCTRLKRYFLSFRKLVTHV